MKTKSALLVAVFACVFAFVYKATAGNTKNVRKFEPENKKVLIVYYSYSGNTKQVAQAIQKITGGDIFEIKAEGTYPQDYNEMVQQAKKEIADNFRPKLTSAPGNIKQYQVIFIGSPNWWGTITPQLSSFLDSYDLSGKTVIPFITHGGGGEQNTVKDLKAQCKGCKVSESAWTNYGKTTSGLEDWIKNLGFGE